MDNQVSQQQPNHHISSNWHSLTVDEALEMLETDSNGLTTAMSKDRLISYGPNLLLEQKSDGPLKRFFIQFHNVLIYVLMVAGVVTAVLEHWIDAGVIFAVVFVNAVIGFIQEGKAEDALKAIRKMLSLRAMVKRNGHWAVVDAQDLVPGDVVMVQSGDRVPADVRLISLKGLKIDESALTGESVSVEKAVAPVAENAALADQKCMAFLGTLVSSGQAHGVVVETGQRAEIGRISSLVAKVDHGTTPLLRQVSVFGRWLTVGILAIAGLTFLYGFGVQGYGADHMFLAAVGLSVAAIPEGLPSIMTITLAIGVQRMARRNAIIRRLPAVESLGEVTVICSDKTGTLTRNEMTVRNVITADKYFDVEGVGYDPHGGFLLDGQDVNLDTEEALSRTLLAAALCNDASIEQGNEDWKLHGDPMEAALLVAGFKAGRDHDRALQEYPRTDLIPFESEHKYMATLHHNHEGKAYLFIKGAPERIIDVCSFEQQDGSRAKVSIEKWRDRTEVLAAKGQRVLAVAVKEIDPEKVELDFKDVEDGFVMLGLFGLIDPPREEVIEAIKNCQDAGIRVKMITGDHSATARAIAAQINLINSEEALTGRDLEKMTDDELAQKIMEVDVYARVDPEHKLRLVNLLQSKGLIVAMTGDGVNDSPALKKADVGVAMGRGGTEAAKEASEMVLADDNFISIVHAVEEGRTIYDNIRKTILFILPTNGGEALTIIAAIALGFEQLPLTPVQILWVNMITAVTLALSLAFEPAEDNIMMRSPRLPDAPLLSLMFIWRIVFVSLILVTGIFGLYVWDVGRGNDIVHARTIAVNTLIFFEIFYLFNSRFILASVVNVKGIIGNRFILLSIFLLLIFQVLFTYNNTMQSLFGTVDLALESWGVILLVSSTVFFLVEIEKAIMRKLFTAVKT